MLKKTTGRFVVGAFALGALLAGCGEGDDAQNMPAMGESSPTATAEQRETNQSDITFAQHMIVHHQQGIQMAKIAPSRTDNQQVIDLAKQIEQTQEPEIETMTSWLQQWDAPAPTDGMPGMNHEGMGDGDVPGMMSAEDMESLREAQGAEFDRMWMEMMIEHHEGAIDMARAELEDGTNPEAKRLAEEAIDSQQAEIDTMKDLLGES